MSQKSNSKVKGYSPIPCFNINTRNIKIHLVDRLGTKPCANSYQDPRVANVIFYVTYQSSFSIKMAFSGRIEIEVISADLTDFIAGKVPEFRKENLNCYVRILVDETELGQTEIIQSTEK